MNIQKMSFILVALFRVHCSALAIILSITLLAHGPCIAAEVQETSPAAEAQTVEEPAVETPEPEESAAQFTLADVEGLAKTLAEKSYENPDGQVPAYLLGLRAKHWNGIRFRQEKSLWAEENLPFNVQFFHPGFIYNRIVKIHVVDNGVAGQLPFSAEAFEYDDEEVATKAAAETTLNYAGFRVHFSINKPDYKDEVAVFLGATYFRSLGRNTNYGISARGLALNTALAEGEEFPYFKEFWLVKPEPDATSLTVYALMDSPSMTGAYEFEIRPGTSTVFQVAGTLFKRKGATLPVKIGIAPLTSMYLFSETHNGSRNDYRPEVHNSDGLLFTTDSNTWHWRPLNNPGRLGISRFSMDSPVGFGLLQRDNSFDHYQDFTARFERRPSLWVEPDGNWGKGELELIEIPSKDEIHDNIIAFWLPSSTAGNGSQAPESWKIGYRLYWMAPNVSPHILGKVAATRAVRSAKNDAIRFFIDFEGENLNALPEDIGLSSVVESPEQFPVIDKQLLKNPVTGGWRLQFTVKTPQQDGVVQSLLTGRDETPRLRLKALLKKGENLPDALTEIWVYDILQ